MKFFEKNTKFVLILLLVLTADVHSTKAKLKVKKYITQTHSKNKTDLNFNSYRFQGSQNQPAYPEEEINETTTNSQIIPGKPYNILTQAS
jgi:hypothetical protein